MSARREKILRGIAFAACLVAGVNWLWFWMFWDIDHNRGPSLLMANVAVWPALVFAFAAARLAWKLTNVER